MSKIHELKTLPELFEAVMDGSKPFEVRKDDGRGFAVGDTLHLREWNSIDPNIDGSGNYTGRECSKRVTYVLSKFWPIVSKGCVVLGLETESCALLITKNAELQDILNQLERHNNPAGTCKVHCEGVAYQIEVKRLNRENEELRRNFSEAQEMVKRFLIPWRSHLDESWITALMESHKLTFGGCGFIEVAKGGK